MPPYTSASGFSLKPSKPPKIAEFKRAQSVNIIAAAPCSFNT